MKYKPMLANQGSLDVLDKKGYIFEPKLDGYRALCYKDKSSIKLISRNSIDITKHYPELDILDLIKADSCVLDGEIVVYDKRTGNPDFSLMQKKRKDDDIKATFVVFDVLELDNKALTSMPLEKRKAILKELLKESDRVQTIFFTDKGKRLLEYAKKRDIEGVLAKKIDSTYQQKRSDNWVKIKFSKTLDCVVLNVTEKMSIEVGLYDGDTLVSIGLVGSGFTEKTFSDLKKKLDEKGTVVAEVRYSQFTQGQKLRAGVFLRLREDKDAKECTFDQVEDSLNEYKKKRDFTKTFEPQGSTKTDKNPIFVVQRHDARRLHFDFRLEHDGVLKSWAVPKGLSDNPSDKRLAVEVEDHPIDYANFEGIIPKGEYGAGTVKIWDKGHYVNITVKKGKVMPLAEAIKKGHFLIWAKGEKLDGGFAFTRTDGKNWLVVRMRDDKGKKYPEMILVGAKRIEFTNQGKNLYAGIKKGDLIEYYGRISDFILAHVKGRPMTLFRFPDGIENGFYQKNISDYFPDWFYTIMIEHDKRKVEYAVCNDKASLMFLANQVAVFHISQARTDKLDYPDKIIFDIDPVKKDLALLKDACKKIKKFLSDIGFFPYIMTTGGKGYHIAVPITRDTEYGQVRKFAANIANVFADAYPNIATTELRKEKRADKIFIDVNRNAHNQTSVAPYSVRAKAGLTIAKPIRWEDLDSSDPAGFDIFSKIDDDPWADFFKRQVSIKDVFDRLKR